MAQTLTAPLGELSDTLAAFDDPVAAEARLRGLRPQVEAAGDHGALLELDTQIARAMGQQGRFGMAFEMLEGVKAALRPGEAGASIRHDLEFGRLLHAKGQPGEARQHLQNAINQAHAARQDALAIDARQMYAKVEPDPIRQVGLNLDAIRFAAASQDPKAQAWQGELWRNVGAARQALGRDAEAAEAFETARAWDAGRSA